MRKQNLRSLFLATVIMAAASTVQMPVMAAEQETQMVTETVTETPKTTEPPVTETPVTEAPVTETPVTESPITEAPVTEAPTTEAPVTETPATEAPATEAPVTEAPATETPATETLATEAPVTEAPTTEAPVTEVPTTEAPTTETPGTEGVETEKETEADLPSETDPKTENKKDTDKKEDKKKDDKKEKETEVLDVAEVEDATNSNVTMPGFSIDPSKYPPANVGENTKTIYWFLRNEMGLNHAAACGVVANVQCESNFNPNSVGDGGTSYGICQWHAGRFSSLMSYCNSNGLDYNTLDGQLAFLKYELPALYSSVYSYLQSVPDTEQGAYDAAYYWCMHFEMPADTVNRSIQRGNLARDYFTEEFQMDEETEEVLNALTEAGETLGDKLSSLLPNPFSTEAHIPGPKGPVNTLI